MASMQEQTLRRFYQSFQQRDAAGMAACYAKDVRFYDPVFRDLEGEQARGMWRLLCQRAKDLTISLDHVQVTGLEARAQWTARYCFAATGRPVVNVVQAHFRFDSQGLIQEHRDQFDFWRWSRQALGPVGLLLGWTPFLQSKVRGQARRGLEAFMKG